MEYTNSQFRIYEPRKEVEVSYSSLGTFASCPRKFAFYKMIRRDRPTWSDGLASAVGRALHEGIQSYFIHRDLDLAIFQLLLHYPYNGDFPMKPQYTDDAAIHTLIYAIENTYLLDYDLLHIATEDGEEVPAIEVPVEIRLTLEDGMVFSYRGYIDFILRNRQTGKLMVWDIKTTTKASLKFFESKYTYDFQNTGYGLVLNAVADAEDVQEFSTGIMGVIIDNKHPQIIETPYDRTQKDVDEFLRWFTDAARKIAEYQAQDWFPRNAKSCIQFNRQCPYFDSCAVSGLDEMQAAENIGGDDTPETIKNSGAQRPEFKPLLVVELQAE